MSAAALAARIRAGDARAAARYIRTLEDALGPGGDPALATAAEEVLRLLYPAGAGAFVIGLTGPPGAGKSTLVDALVTAYRARGDKVGVVAVDPSSPFSGGAILGDRIRMQRHALDPGVFIRSLATRGQGGGLARAAGDVAIVQGALGADVVILETVGVGQGEVDVALYADVVAVVLVPGLGDDIQALKAGLLEIADLFVVNKADREGADRVVADLRAAMALGHESTTREIVSTVASDGRGVPALFDLLQKARAARGGPEGQARRRRQAAARLELLLLDRLRRQAERAFGGAAGLEAMAGEVAEGRLDPYAAVARLLAGHA